MKAARWLFVGLATVVAIVLSLGFAIVVGLWFMYGWRVDNGWLHENNVFVSASGSRGSDRQR